MTRDETSASLAADGSAFVDLGFAKVDTGRCARTGAGEVVYGAGKTASQIASICRKLGESGQRCVLVTRLDAGKAADVAKHLTAANTSLPFEYREIPKLGIYGSIPAPARESYIAVACAGTSDLYCAEEAAVTAEVLGTRVVRLFDVGVAGIHRLLSCADRIRDARCIVAVAGMEGALASVIAGMASCPVIAVPTSVGYGASFGGVAALLAMLNSCASGVSVVNIDNGFGAGFQAHLIEESSARVTNATTEGKQMESMDAPVRLRWNLTENATRSQLLGDTLLQLPAASREKLEAAAAAAGVPDRHHRNIAEVSATIDALAVSERVRADMHAIYDILAQAEAAAHGVDVSETHFHEVGEGSRIRNTLLLCLAVEALSPERIVATVAQIGEGTIRCAHGELAVPAPATAAIIARGIPTCEKKLPGERMTPTSAAMLLHFVDEYV